MNNATFEQIQEIEQKVRQTMIDYSMDSNTIVVGLSGGADSIALTHFLKNNWLNQSRSLIAAHINHGLRGEESDFDESFVRNWCKKNQITLQIKQVNIRTLAEENKLGLEECGREVRYGFFHELAKGNNDRIATAHTLSDSCETVLLNLANGAGAHGLCGIPPVRDNIIRPFIRITRTEVEQYCNYYGLRYVTDSTNLSTEYSRNKIRLNVIPNLKKINASFESAVLRMTQQLSEDEDCLIELAEQGLKSAQTESGYQIKIFQEMHPAVRARAVALAVKKIKQVRLSSKHIQKISQIICCGRGNTVVAGNLYICAEGTEFSITIGKPEKYHWCVPITYPETLTEDGRTLIIKVIRIEEYEKYYKFNNLLFNNAIDYDTISNNTSVRNRIDGDSFSPLGRKVTKSLKKLFNEAKIPPSKRDRIMMIESNGKLIWIEGFGVSQICKISDNTKNVALITIKGE